MNLLESIAENAIHSITLQVDVEKLTSEIIAEIYEMFVVDLKNSVSKDQSNKNTAKERKTEESDIQNAEIPLNFELFDRSGNRIKMFSRTCKIRKSRELYEYFENNDVVRMKIN